MTTEEQIKYAMHLSRVLVLHNGAIRQSCILSTKVLTEVLRSLGIGARPVCASVLVMTDGWLKRCEKEGRPPRPDEWDAWWDEDRAYSVGVLYDENPKPGAYSGHMIVLAGQGQTWLCDPSIDQLSRPHRDLPLSPLMFDLTNGASEEERHEFRRGRTQAVSHWLGDQPGEQDCHIVWSIFPRDRSFREVGDWTNYNERWKDISDSVFNAVRMMRDEGLTGDALPPLPPLPDAPDNPALMTRPAPIGPGNGLHLFDPQAESPAQS